MNKMIANRTTGPPTSEEREVSEQTFTTTPRRTQVQPREQAVPTRLLVS